MPRLYQPIWEEIKKRDKCFILVVNPGMVSTVKRGVIKEKDQDLGFKILNDTDKLKLQISYDEKTGEMRFELTNGLGMKEIVR